VSHNVDRLYESQTAGDVAAAYYKFRQYTTIRLKYLSWEPIFEVTVLLSVQAKHPNFGVLSETRTGAVLENNFGAVYTAVFTGTWHRISILRQTNPCHALTTYVFQTVLMLSSHLRSGLLSKWSLSSNINFVCIYNLSHMCYMFYPSVLSDLII
jgi:hypothetical protein